MTAGNSVTRGSHKASGGFCWSAIRPRYLVYSLAYALELMLFAARGQFLPIGASFFGIRGWTVVHAVHMAASLVFMLAWGNRFRGLLRLSVGLMVLGFFPFVLLPMGLPRAICALVFYIGLGGAVTGARCGFAFAANNSERLLGMVGMFLAVAGLRFVRSLGAEGAFVTYVLPLCLLAGLCWCLLQFREEDFSVKEEAGDKKGLYWAFAFFALYFAFDGYNAALVEGYRNPDFLYFFLGMLAAAGLLFACLGHYRINPWHLWNVFFLASFGMGLLAHFAPQLGTQKPQYLFGGLSMLGWPLSIYTLGCAQSRFASYRLLKRCTAIYVLLSPVITLSSDLVERFAPEALPLCAMLFILAVGIAFLMVSPFSYRQLFCAQWMEELHLPAMTASHPEDPFEAYRLTPRQKEVAALLLAAKTGRQIAGELGLSESTVKLHTSQLYKRLGITSRTELFLLFGGLDREKDKP